MDDVPVTIGSPKRTVGLLAPLVLAAGVVLLVVIAAFELHKALSAVRSIADLKDRYGLENEILKDAVQLIGAFLLFVGFYFTNRTISISRDTQITDRFNKAVDHLGSEKLQIRMGGLYALGRIARDSVRDRREIAELISAFVREQTKEASEGGPCSDVQAALRILGSPEWNLTLTDGTIDLSNTNLGNADLRSLRLDSASFEGGNLRNANFENASLRRCNFAGALCVGARFRASSLRDANLTAADISEGTLRDSDLEGASLLGATLCGTSLRGARMKASRFATRDQIGEAIVDENTELPTFDDVARPEPDNRGGEA
jgi:uncharacterized protein YjbI with pentapeptide repeats